MTLRFLLIFNFGSTLDYLYLAFGLMTKLYTTCYMLETVLLKPENHYNVSYLVDKYRLHTMSCLKPLFKKSRKRTELKDVAHANEGKKENTCNTKHLHQTPSKTDVKEKDWRKHYLMLPIEPKRQEYQCGSNFVMLDRIPTWAKYAGENYDKYDMKDVKQTHEVNDELNQKISLWQGDITRLEIDAIANAANSSLLGGGGVDGAIHKAAGNKLEEECAKLNRCDTGDAKLSGGYKLPAKYVIHTVGPIGEQEDKLASCYKNCLNIAKENNIRTIAFPCISTGIYGYDVTKATPIALKTVRNWLLMNSNRTKIDRIIFCVFLENCFDVYIKNLLRVFPLLMPEDKEPLEVTKSVHGEHRRKDSKIKETKNNESGVKEEPINKPIPDAMNCKTEDEEDSIEEMKLNNTLPDKNADRQSEVKSEGNEAVKDDNHLLPSKAKEHGDSPQKLKGKDESFEESDDHSPAAKKKSPYQSHQS